ncbi:MAG: FIST C-terminal domain-containing protein [Chloroflexi bacterium]|nr:FIST C-terminal domain-containing protein [Chloroflexota bacterium]
MSRPSRDVATELLVSGSGLGLGADWRSALGQALDGALGPLRSAAPDLLVLFVSAAYGDDYAEVLDAAAQRSAAREIAGCSASGVIAQEREVEDQPGVAALALRLPPGALLAVRQAPDNQPVTAAWLGMDVRACKGLIVLADPFTTDAPTLIEGLEHAYPGVPIVGGMATGHRGVHATSVFHGRHVSTGALVIGLGGKVGLRPVVSQGCEPIGENWTITDAEGHVVKAIGGRPAYELLVEMVRGLDAERRARVNGNLLVGLAMDEYRDEFRRGDFLIRNLMGVDPQTGAIAIAAHARIGQTLQFQIRDARAADEELRTMLGVAAGLEEPAAALLFACNGRGIGLFGSPDHDVRSVRSLLGPVPLAGLFCNGEIGPVGASTYVHGLTASLALIATAD